MSEYKYDADLTQEKMEAMLAEVEEKFKDKLHPMPLMGPELREEFDRQMRAKYEEGVARNVRQPDFIESGEIHKHL